jgi:hypothetical protein
MESREAVFSALKEGRTLTSNITGLQYILIDGKLHARLGDVSQWHPSQLSFENPQSWLNLRD